MLKNEVYFTTQALNLYTCFSEMSGVQGIIVCGEASESDEEEEFCAATARGHRGKC